MSKARSPRRAEILDGEPLDQKKFEPIFATMAELDLPIWLHPVGTAAMPDYPSEKKSRYEMWWCFGWPYETSVAMARLVFSGVFDRHPALLPRALVAAPDIAGTESFVDQLSSIRKAFRPLALHLPGYNPVQAICSDVEVSSSNLNP